jgi:MFS family permease
LKKGEFYMSVAAANLVKPKSVFFNRNFMLLFSGKIISQLGDQVFAFALSWYILDITKSSLAMSIFLVINCIIGATVSPFGGIIADRFDRKKILVWMDGIRGFIVIISALLLYFQMLEIWMFYVSTVILGFCGAIFSPTASAVIPNVVEEDQLTEASSMDLFTWNFTSIVGMIIGSIFYHLIGVAAVFLINAMSYFISGVFEAVINVPLSKPTGPASKKPSLTKEFSQVAQSLYEGYQYVKANQLLFKLILMYAIYFLIGYPLGMLYVPYTFNVILKAIPLQLSIALGATFFGVLMGSVLVPLFLKRYRLRKSIFWGMLIFSLGYIIVAALIFTPFKGYFSNWGITMIWAVISFIVGIGMASFNIPTNLIFQKYTSDEYRGRFWGLQLSITTFSMAIGYLAGGFLAENVWMGFLFVGSSLAIFAIDLWAVNIKEIKEFGC